MSIDDARRTDAWRQLHYAAQIAAELGKGWANPRDDDSHSSFDLVGSSLVGVPAGGRRARLDLHALAVSIDEEHVKARHNLAGRTFDEAMQWIRAAAEEELGPAAQPSKPAPDLPEHPVAEGRPFSRDDEALAAVAALYDRTARALADRGFGPIRCWPHHFDLAALVEGPDDQTIGLGVTPPDDIESSGYWYVSPWSPRSLTWDDPPALPAGRWKARESGLPIAILPIAEAADLDGFLDAAFAACQRFLFQD